MKTAVVTINGEPHEVKELPAAKNAAWRRQFEGRVADIMGALERLPQAEIGNTEDLLALVREFLPTVLGATDALVELAVAYDPALGDAYESEIMQALPGILALGFPFVGLARATLAAPRPTNGAQTMTTTGS